MKLTKTAKWFYWIFTVSITLLLLSCKEGEEPTPDTELDDIGTLIDESENFTHFAILIAIADREVPEGEQGIMEMLKNSDSGNLYTIFAPSDDVFDALAVEWSTPDFQVSAEEVIGEFTHNGQPAKTRDFVLGHIFKSDKQFEAASFDANLNFSSSNGTNWTMISTQEAESGYGFVLEGSSVSSNPYLIGKTDLLMGSNGVVHAALVN